VDIIDLFHKGGELMWVILIGLILETVVILERSLYFWLISYPYSKFEKILKKQIQKNKNIKDINLEYPTLAKKKNNKVSKILWKIKNFFYTNAPSYKIGRDYINYMSYSRKSREEAIQRHSVKLITQMEKFTRILGTTANVVPLVGLLGTVTGLIKAFQKIASLGGTVDVNQLAGGIFEAMLTTAFGLIVAVPAFIAFDFFEQRISKRVDYMNFTIQHLNESYFDTSDDTGNTIEDK